MIFRRVALAAFILAVAGPLFAAFDDPNLATTTLATSGLFFTAALVFAAGVGISLTPCVYPMIPITLSIIGARSAGQKPVTGFLRALVFVLGIATIYTALGYFAAVTGRSISFVFQNRWFIGSIAIFFMLMGMSMLDMFTIQLPASWAGKLQGGANKGGFVGAFLLGLVTGIVASPCGSPVLVGVLAIAAQSGQGGVGVTLLFMYALGLGMLFLVLGTFPAFLSSLPKSGVWMEDIKKFLGLCLIGVGVYYLSNPLVPAVFWVIVILAAIGGAAIAAIYANKRSNNTGLRYFWRVTGLALLAFGLFAGVSYAYPALTAEEEVGEDITVMLGSGLADGPAVLARGTETTTGTAETTQTESAAAAADAPPADWLTDEAAALELAKRLNAPVMIDFTATWCAACKELDKKTFVEPEVKAAMAPFVKVKIDCTRMTDENKALQQKYGALSLPTVAFISASGEFQKDLSLYTFEEPAKFLERLAKVER